MLDLQKSRQLRHFGFVMQNTGQNNQDAVNIIILDQTWPGVSCHPLVESKPLLFSHIAGPFRGQNQPVDQITDAALL